MISSLIAMGTAFLVFYFTIQYEKNKEKKQQIKINKNRIVYLSSLVRSSIKNVEDTLKKLDHLIKEFENDAHTFHSLNIYPNRSFERMHELF